jgi:hypothetical protein
VREAAKIASARIAARTRRVRPGSRSSWTRPSEPLSTALQKKSVALVPNTPPVGTA